MVKLRKEDSSEKRGNFPTAAQRRSAVEPLAVSVDVNTNWGSVSDKFIASLSHPNHEGSIGLEPRIV